MSPTIEEIIAGVSTRQFTQLQAVKWLYQHIETSTDNDGLRDHFAGLAMQTMLTLCQQDDYGRDYLAHCAKNSYLMADAMLKARTA